MGVLWELDEPAVCMQPSGWHLPRTIPYLPRSTPPPPRTSELLWAAILPALQGLGAKSGPRALETLGCYQGGSFGPVKGSCILSESPVDSETFSLNTQCLGSDFKHHEFC